MANGLDYIVLEERSEGARTLSRAYVSDSLPEGYDRAVLCRFADTSLSDFLWLFRHLLGAEEAGGGWFASTAGAMCAMLRRHLELRGNFVMEFGRARGE